MDEHDGMRVHADALVLGSESCCCFVSASYFSLAAAVDVFAVAAAARSSAWICVDLRCPAVVVDGAAASAAPSTRRASSLIAVHRRRQQTRRTGTERQARVVQLATHHYRDSSKQQASERTRRACARRDLRPSSQHSTHSTPARARSVEQAARNAGSCDIRS